MADNLQPYEDGQGIVNIDPACEDQLIGTIFEGKYKIESKIGQGGMGVVYRATHTFIERKVAIKFLNSDRLTDTAAIERFKQEARAAGRILHPNATAVLDFGLSNSVFYLVMEYLEGRTLRARLRESDKPTNKEIIRIFSQVCEAVDAAHKVDVIHRDLKPDNIFLQQQGGGEIVKVLDFGIAKIIQGVNGDGLVSGGLTADMLVGTPHYMSPEQILDEKLSTSTDIYSLGVMLFELLSGQLPFRGESAFSIAVKHSNEEPPDVRNLRPDLPEAVALVIKRAMAKKPAERQRSALELANEFRLAIGKSNARNSARERADRPAVCSNKNCAAPNPSDEGRCLHCQALLVGELVRHRYQIEHTVGKGGFGMTYLVKDQDCFDELRILKELRPEIASIDQESDDISDTAERLFKREAQTLLGLQHAGIPKLYAYFIEGDHSYLVQDFIPGQTLAEELNKRGRVYDEAEALSVLLEIAEILEYLHTRAVPIVHRDIKPQNLMRHADGKLQLIDFGAVCQAASQMSSNTLIGSPGYAPPEQLFGNPVTQSDLYAAGVTALRLMTGLPPMQMFNHRLQRLEWRERVKVSAGFAELLESLLQPAVSMRMESATVLKKQLQRLLGVETSGATVKKETAELPSLSATMEIPVADITRNYDGKQVNTGEDEKTGTQLQHPLPVTPPQATVAPEELGELTQMPLPKLLQRCHRQRMSGQLSCIGPERTWQLYFEEGALVFIDSDPPGDQLEEMLINKGTLTYTEYQQVKKLMAAEGLRCTPALIKLNILHPDKMKPLISEHYINIIAAIFEWGAGRYEITRQASPEKVVSMAAPDLIIEGMRRLQNVGQARHWLGDFKRKLTVTQDSLSLCQGINLNPKEVFIISRIDSVMSIEEILTLSGLPDSEVYKTLCALLAVGILEWVEEQNPAASAPTKQPPAAAKTTPKPAQEIDIQGAAVFCYEVENMLSALEGASHYAVLGVERSATLEKIKEASEQLRKKFSPERCTQFTSSNKNLLAQLEKITARVFEAYRVLTDHKSRDEYDNRLRATGKVTRPLPRRD